MSDHYWTTRRWLGTKVVQVGLRVAFGRNRGRELDVTLHADDEQHDTKEDDR